MTHSITILPAAFRTAIEMLSLCTSIPIYLVLIIEGVPFWRSLRQAPKPYSKRGALSYCVALPVTWNGVFSSYRFARFPGLSERHAVGCLAAIPLDKSPTAIQKTMALCQILFWGKPIVEAVCLLQIAHHRSSRSHVQRKRKN